MDRHFLVTVSEDKSALHGIRFINNFFKDKRKLYLTFFYSSPQITVTPDLNHNLHGKTRFKRMEKHFHETGRKAVESAIAKSLELGFQRSCLNYKIQASNAPTAVDIIQEGERGVYAAIILGKRSLGLLDSALESSTSKFLFNRPFNFPLWICRDIEQHRANVLLYGDGSDGSFKITEHIGAMVGMSKQHQVDLLLENHLQSDPLMLKRYESILKEHRLVAGKIEWIDAPRHKTANHILALADKRKYAAVALGREAGCQNIFHRLFHGPVSSILFRQLSHCALLVCQS